MGTRTSPELGSVNVADAVTPAGQINWMPDGLTGPPAARGEQPYVGPVPEQPGGSVVNAPMVAT